MMLKRKIIYLDIVNKLDTVIFKGFQKVALDWICGVHTIQYDISLSTQIDRDATRFSIFNVLFCFGLIFLLSVSIS